MGHQPDHHTRAILPIPDRQIVGLTTYDARDPDAKFPPIEPLRPPEGAPNVLIILLDDVGFAASSAFGGPCNTPVAERLAAGGLKYNRFHTTALCAPTRAALLTGRNHHTVGMGVVTELATSAPGYSSVRPNTCAPLAEMLKHFEPRQVVDVAVLSAYYMAAGALIIGLGVEIEPPDVLQVELDWQRKTLGQAPGST